MGEKRWQQNSQKTNKTAPDHERAPVVVEAFHRTYDGGDQAAQPATIQTRKSRDASSGGGEDQTRLLRIRGMICVPLHPPASSDRACGTRTCHYFTRLLHTHTRTGNMRCPSPMLCASPSFSPSPCPPSIGRNTVGNTTMREGP